MTTKRRKLPEADPRGANKQRTRIGNHASNDGTEHLHGVLRFAPCAGAAQSEIAAVKSALTAAIGRQARRGG
jgi:hypothetical protein